MNYTRKLVQLARMNRKHLLILLALLSVHWSCLIEAANEAPEEAAGSHIRSLKSHTDNTRDDNQLIEDEPTSFFRENSLQETFNGQLSYDQYINYAMRALALVAGFDNDLHRYDSKQDLINSYARNHSLQSEDQIRNWRNQPILATAESDLLADQKESILIENEQNQMKCEQQLESITKAVSKLLSNPQEFAHSNQLSLIDYLDSFGAPGAQTMQGNFMWLGSKGQCSSASLTSPSMDNDNGFGEKIETRYCIANFRSPNWTTDGLEVKKLGSFSFKIGVCLPRSCNSISYFRNGNRIESLIRLVRLNQVPLSSYKLVHLFCLPDENSPLRQFSWSARTFILLLSSWLTTLIYFSLKYEYQRMKWLSDSQNSLDKFNEKATNVMRIFALRLSWSKLFASNSDRPVEEKIQVFALDENGAGRSLKTAERNSTWFKSNDQGEVEDQVDASTGEHNTQKVANIVAVLRRQTIQVKADSLEILRPTLQLADREEPLKSSIIFVDHNGKRQEQVKTPTIDLSCIDGIKVLSMIWLISGHTLLFFIRNIANGRDFWSVLKDARFMTIMAGIFPVDTFFTITGILTAYLKFNKNSGKAMSTIKYWLEAFVHRYFRFMPMYLIVFWYTRDVSEYIGSGPLWDYATADTSLRSTCKQESFSVPILFQANFKPIDQHCVKPAWYLANDYQYLLLTPIFMSLIMKSRCLGYLVISLSILSSLILQFLTVYHSVDMDDFETLINFKPMFGAYVLKNLWKLYVLPYNRIPPYLIGIMTGHMMYSLKKTKSEHNKQQQATTSASLNSTKDTTSPDVHGSLASLKSHYKSTSTIMSASSTGSSAQNLPFRLMHDFTSYLCIRIWAPLVFLISIIYLPMLTRIATQKGLAAKIGTSSIIALMRFVWSIAIARLIYICSTRFILGCRTYQQLDSFVIRFLSSTKWKPWSKMGLSALLIQWEIISYLAQIQTSAPNMTISFLLAIVLLSVIITYLLAIVIYLTIEYPLSQVEQLYLKPAIFSKT